ncbi:transglutaminase-like domain-containing protein [Mariniluteicoccus endophyticus]
MSTVLNTRRGLHQPVLKGSRRLWVVVDLLAIWFVGVLATAAFWPAYGTPVWRAGMGAVVLGSVLGMVAQTRRWPLWLVAVGVVVLHLGAGGAFAMPSSALLGVLPTPTTISGMAGGVVTGWKTALTVAPPIGELGALLAVPYATLLVAATAAGYLALDRRRATRAWLPLAAAAVVGTLMGLHTATHPLLIGLGFALGVPVWTAYRRSFLRQALVGLSPKVTWQRAVAGALVLAVAGGSAAALMPVLKGVDSRRVVLRDVVEPPVDVRQWPSPLQEMRAQVVDRADRVLLTADGLPAGARVRLATLDAYDGTTYMASNESSDGAGGAFRRIGDSVPDATDGERATVHLTVGDYAGVWLPTSGATRGIRFTSARRLALKEHLYLNRDSGTAVTAAGLRPGDELEVDVTVPPTVTPQSLRDAQSARTMLAPLPPLPDELKARAAKAAEGSQGDGDTALRIQNVLKAGYYSHGTDHDSLPGHSLFRVRQLFTVEPMVGDEEQYAVAFALMAREVGLPARVVYGFAPTSGGGPVELRGRDVTAWVEIRYAEAGWVAYEAGPPKDRRPPAQSDPPANPTNPQVDNPPPPPDRPDRLPPDQTDPEQPGQNDDPRQRTLWARYGYWVMVVGGPLALLAAPFVIIGGAKLRRRRVRAAAPHTADRVSGGWAEVVDRARDLGVPLSPSATRIETARAVADRFARSADGSSDPLQLAFRADATTFGTGTPSVRQAEEYWRGVRDVLRGMTRSVPATRRVAGLLSLRSLRSPAAWRREAKNRGRLRRVLATTWTRVRTAVGR